MATGLYSVCAVAAGNDRRRAQALAAACGFGSPTQMKRAFERQLGIGPREYRVLDRPAA